MKKTLITTATIALLALTGCSNTEQQTDTPETTTPETTTASAPSASPTLSTAEEFEGVTLKGNDLYFAFLNPGQQEFMNNVTGKNYSWGVLCSPTATIEQLTDTGVSVQDPDGDNSVLRSVQHAVNETTMTSNAEAEIESIFSTATYPDTTGKNCVGVVSDDGEVAGRSYDTVTEGYYADTTELVDTAELYRK